MRKVIPRSDVVILEKYKIDETKSESGIALTAGDDLTDLANTFTVVRAGEDCEWKKGDVVITGYTSGQYKHIDDPKEEFIAVEAKYIFAKYD